MAGDWLNNTSGPGVVIHVSFYSPPLVGVKAIGGERVSSAGSMAGSAAGRFRTR
jgi:hypothetical protein